jgi:hypothetical protein
LKEEDAPFLGNIFRELIAKVELRGTHEQRGKLTRSRVAGGEVVLRASEEVYCLFPWATRTGQVIQLPLIGLELAG